MRQTARVESVEALEVLRAALAKFAVAAQGALGSAAAEIQRTLAWLDSQRKHLQAQVLRRQEEVLRAKSELAQRRWGHDKGQGRGATEQEIALKKAQHRLREAEEKVAAVRRWQRLLPDAIKEYEGPARQLGGMVDADLRHSLALLDKGIAALEAYTSLTAPGPPLPADQCGPISPKSALGGDVGDVGPHSNPPSPSDSADVSPSGVEGKPT